MIYDEDVIIAQSIAEDVHRQTFELGAWYPVMNHINNRGINGITTMWGHSVWYSMIYPRMFEACKSNA